MKLVLGVLHCLFPPVVLSFNLRCLKQYIWSCRERNLPLNKSFMVLKQLPWWETPCSWEL